MKRNLRRNLLLALALAAVIAGAVLALASGGHHRSRHATSQATKAGRASLPGDTEIAASYLGISRAALRRRLRGGASLAEVADAARGRSAAGLEQALLAPHRSPAGAQRLSAQEEADRIKRLRHRISEEVMRRRRGLGDIAVAARYLGLSEAALRGQLLHGRSMASIASSTAGRSRAALIERIARTRSQRVARALAARIITAKQARRALALLKTRATREVDRVLPRR